MEEIQHGTRQNAITFRSAQLAALGLHHTAKKCCEKVITVNQDYNRIKDCNYQSRLDQSQ